MVKGGKGVAVTALELFTDEEVLRDMKGELEVRKGVEDKEQGVWL
ncbi:amidohydrolase [Cytobacillus oceanisediminis]|nr:amidohydrolase [Cytobacillus oceanisediminis]